MEKEYAIGIDLGGTSVKYALIDNEGVFYFQGKLPSKACLLYTSPSPRDVEESRMPSSA